MSIGAEKLHRILTYVYVNALTDEVLRTTTTHTPHAEGNTGRYVYVYVYVYR